MRPEGVPGDCHISKIVWGNPIGDVLTQTKKQFFLKADDYGWERPVSGWLAGGKSPCEGLEKRGSKGVMRRSGRESRGRKAFARDVLQP